MMKAQKLLIPLLSLLSFCSYAADQRKPLPHEAMMRQNELRRRKALEDKLWEAISYQQTFGSARLARLLFAPEKEKTSVDQKNKNY
jgi:hypothetical protein